MRNKITLAAVALTAAAALTLSACGGGEDGRDDTGRAPTEVSATLDKAATVLDRPFDKPPLILTDTKGETYDFVKETRGRPTLIYFGYTNCPDVCPLTMSNIAIAKKALPRADQDRLRVVFVTTDPERDTPASLGKWLKAQDPEFIGLTGDFPTIQAGARRLGIHIEPATKEKDGKVNSMHGTQVVAFSPKTDKGYVLYGEDATADDYTQDLPELVEGAKP
ncbi:SCO family protein [Streptomyces sp. GC420]|uniref:SCO family protein n=1 Tax=Streptomyces sp. GC420 TaxID=2697568 RepID=UPI0014150213|nr:SCO family protein [Streptomyces sp. GC420]NBM20308.1 SCO family protein [Streptomyces sp. GC420]